MKLLKQFNLFLRSLIFLILFCVIIFPYSILCLMAMIFPLRVRYAMVSGWTGWMIWLLKVTCRVDYKIEGLENIPKDQACVVLSKHQSTWETLILPTLFHETAIIIKRELLWLPCFGWGLMVIDPIAINRSKKSSAMEQILTKGKRCLEQGRCILIFPEGTRMPVGTVGNYRPGGARVAINAGGYPIIPVAHNAGRYWPKRKFIKLPGTVHMVIGKPIETKNRQPEEVTEEVKNWIESTMKRIDG